MKNSASRIHGAQMTGQPGASSEVLIAIKAGRRRRNSRYLLVTGSLAVFVVLCLLLQLVLGEVKFSAVEIWQGIWGNSGSSADFIVGQLRFPRAILGLLVGAAFGMAGCASQVLLRNQLASPDIIGITSGTSAAAVFAILMLGLKGMAVSAIAITFGVLTAALILWLAGGGKVLGGRLILIGIGVGAMFNSAISYMQLKAKSYDVPAALQWISGSLNAASLKSVPFLLIVLLLGGAILLSQSKALLSLRLGEEVAISHGINPNRTKRLVIITLVLLVAAATATTGPIMFVAFLAGPITIKLLGPAASQPLLPSALTGAALVLGCDLLAQHAFSTNYPVGVLTGMIGAPYLIFLLITSNRSGASA